MLTECPSCLTVFRVTGAILKMGHGQVRCGKCRTQFDALDSLLDEDEAASDTPKAESAATSAASATEVSSEVSSEEPAIEAREPEISEEITLEGTRIEISGTYRVAADEHSASSEPAPEQIIHEHVVIDRDEPVLETPTENDDPNLIEPVEEQIVEINLDDGEPVAEAANHLLEDTGAAPAEEHVPLSQRIWKRARSQRHSEHHAARRQIAEELDALTQTPSMPSSRDGAWTAAAIALVIALLVQVIHHYRDPLVRNPKWGPTISRVYRAVGLTLTPNWDLSAYEMQQWGVVSDAAARDALRVRASVTNTAAFAQPYPHVKLSLQDRWGATVAMREFAPEEYLPSAATADRMMAPRQRANAEIVIVDPGADAVGFQIFACLPRTGGVVCSDDLPANRE